MTIGNAIFQGIVQGLTEFLPVSSSGHLSLVQYFTGQGSEYGLFFTVLLHVGTLLAVVLAFWSTIAGLVVEFFKMLPDVFRGRFKWKTANPKRRMIVLLILSLFPLIITVFLRDWLTAVATNDSLFVEGFAFLFTSGILFLSERCIKGYKTAKDMKARDALVIGTMQAFAAVPGISRSGSTIAAGLIMGLDRKYAVAFSFIMGVPAVLGASILEMREAIHEGVSYPVSAMVIGILFSLIFGLLAIRAIRWLVVSDKFKYFAWYTLVLGILVLGVATVEHFTDGMIRAMIIG
ncbi:MAG: undecaprenyl-diphosphate phosphatase [Oscillospiraceae bacterium]|nr:undecaprenyl-diphosphate phosphatase [Oscillospiraceae bacterium]